MGLALIIPNADFSANNIGKVSILQDVAVTAIALTSGAQTNNQIQISPSFTPSNTSRRGITWSLIINASYTEYVSISQTGLLTISSGASAVPVTVVATSTSDTSVIGQLALTVTYVDAPVELTSISISGADTVSGTSTYTAAYTPTNTSYKGVTWSINSGSAYASIDSSTGKLTALDGASASSVTIKATSTHDNSITATKTISVTYVSLVYELSTQFQGDGASTYLDTGVKLYDTVDKNWTVIGYFKTPATKVNTSDCNNNNVQFINCVYNSSPWPGLGIGFALVSAGDYHTDTSATGVIVYYGNGKSKVQGVTTLSDHDYLVAITKSGSTYHAYLFDSSSVALTDLLTDTVSAVTQTWNYTAVLGAQRNTDGSLMRFWNGIVKRLKIYTSVLSANDILAELKSMYNSVNGTSL